MWNNWEQLQCVAHSPLIVGTTKALLLSLGTCIVQKQSVRVNSACTKGLFNLSAEAIRNVRNSRLRVRCAKFFLNIKHIPFSCRLVKGFTFLKRLQNQFKMLLEMCIVLASIVPTEKCEVLDGYVTTPRSIQGFGKCGAWLFVHKVPFLLQDHVKTTKTDKARFFFAKKRWSWNPTNNCYFLPNFIKPNIERKNCVWTTNYERLLEMCIVQHVEMKRVLIFQPIKRPFSTTVKRAKPAATFWIFLSRTKNRQ